MIERLLTNAEAQLQANHLDDAQQLADAARAINPQHPRVAFLEAQIGAQRERAVLGKAQRAAASGNVAGALAVLDDATREHRSPLAAEARQELAQKQVDTRVASVRIFRQSPFWKKTQPLPLSRMLTMSGRPQSVRPFGGH